MSDFLFVSNVCLLLCCRLSSFIFYACLNHFASEAITVNETVNDSHPMSLNTKMREAWAACFFKTFGKHKYLEDATVQEHITREHADSKNMSALFLFRFVLIFSVRIKNSYSYSS